MQAALLRHKRCAPGRLSPQLGASPGRLSPQFLTTSASEPDLPPLSLSQTRPLHRAPSPSPSPCAPPAAPRLSSSHTIPNLDAALQLMLQFCYCAWFVTLETINEPAQPP